MLRDFAIDLNKHKAPKDLLTKLPAPVTVASTKKFDLDDDSEYEQPRTTSLTPRAKRTNKRKAEGTPSKPAKKAKAWIRNKQLYILL